ncbi:MAG: N-acetylmuramoyl-L-alanine amidase [Clostridia bacterium]
MRPARPRKNWPFPLILVVLVVAGCVTLPTRARAGAPTAMPQAGEEKPARILAVNYAEVEGRGTVTVSLAGPGKAAWKSFLLRDPARLVVDIEGAVLPSRPEPLPVGDGIVDKVRIAQFSSDVVRLVLDLYQESAYTVTQPEENPHEIVIAFPQRVTGLEFHEVDGRAEAVVRGTGKLKYKTSVLIDPPRIVVDLPGTVLVGNPGPMPVSHAIARQIRASQHSPDTVRVVVDLARETTYSVFTSSDRPGEVVVDFGHRILGAAFTTHLKSTRVSVKSTGLPPAKVTRLTEPHRLVMDFEDSVLDAPECAVEVGDGTIERIRLAQFGPMTVRVVVDLPYYVGHSELPRALGPDGSLGETAVEITRSPLYKKTIVVDPGHGGSDPGAVGATGLQEKAVTLDISKRVAAMLGEAGAKAVLTRTDDVSAFLPERVKVAAEARADVFVSVHANAGKTETSSGTETLFCSSVPMNRRLAEHVQASLVREIGLPDRGIRERPDLYVIREAKMPSCLVEVLFMSNLAEELLLMDPSFRDRAARGITKGIWSYFEWRLEAAGAEGAGTEPGAARETGAKAATDTTATDGPPGHETGAEVDVGTGVIPATGAEGGTGPGPQAGNGAQTGTGAPAGPATDTGPHP